MVFFFEMWAFIFSTILLTLIISLSWKHRKNKSGKAFIIFMSLALIWTLFFVLELSAQTKELKMLFLRLQFLAISAIPVAWLYMVLNYTGERKKDYKFLFLLIVPFISIVLTWLPQPNPFWGNPTIINEGIKMILMDYDYGFWFYFIHAPYSYILILVSLVILIRSYFSKHDLYRNQIASITVAILLPLITDVLYVMGISPVEHINYSSAVFSISCVIIAFSLFKYKLFEILPLARNLVFENMDDAVLILDVKYRLIDINPVAFDMTGIKKEDIGKPLEDIRCEVCEFIRGMIRTGRKNMEIKLDSKVFELRLSLISSSNTFQGNVITIIDCTERAELFDKIKEQATYDHMTKVYNRRHFFEQGQKEISKIKRGQLDCISVIILDIDRFKYINDTFGHITGDIVIETFSSILKNSIRDYDIIGRIGGDEFAVLLPSGTLSDALVVAERMIGNIKDIEVKTKEGKPIPVSASIGIASTENMASNQLEFDDIVHTADEHMYKSKREGYNNISY